MTAQALLMAFALAQSAPAPAGAPQPRTTVVISDLHMGPGQKGKEWDRYEDFRWADEFAAFLSSLDGVASGPVDLVVAGDLLELWQARDGLCPSNPDKRDLGCTSEEAVARTAATIEDHRAELAALQRFAETPGNRLVLLPGNHDVHLLFPAVADELRKALPAAKLEERGWWLSDDGLTLVDHGHQIGGGAALNSFVGWPQPFLEDKSFWCSSGKQHVRRPWGEQFVVEFYDGWEDRFAVIDNTTEELAGAKLAMKLLGVPKALEATGELVRFLVFDVSLSQLVHSLGSDAGKAIPTWNVAEMRKGGDAALAAALPPEDPIRELLAAGELAPALKRGHLRSAIDAFDDDQLRAICDKELLNRQARSGPGASVTLPCPADAALGGDGQGALGGGEGTLGWAAVTLAGGEGQALEKHLRALRKASGVDFKTYVYGHTHAVREPWQAIAVDEWRPYALNAGAWQRVVTPAQISKFLATKESAAAFLSRTPERLPPCYTFAVIRNGDPSSRAVRSWRKVNGAWGFGAARECAAFEVEP